MKNIFDLALKNIISFRKKSFAAILAIASGFIALNLFQSYIYDATLLFQSTYSQRSMYSSALIRKEKRYEGLNVEEQNQIELFLKNNSSEIIIFSRQLYFSGTANTGQNQFFFLGMGYDIEKGQQLRGKQWARNAVYGRSLAAESTDPEISVGEGFSYLVGCHPLNKIIIPIEKRGYHHPQIDFNCPFERLQLAVTTSSGQINALDTKIVGIQDGLFKEIDDRLVVTSLPLAQTLMNTKDISFYSIKLADDRQLSKVQDKFKTQVKSQHPTILLDTWKNFDVGDFYRQTISFLTLFRNFFSIIVISIGMLSVMATFYRLIHERRKEIGILRSIGLKNSFIVQLFIAESLLLSLTGVTIGLVFSIFFAAVLNQLEIPYYLGMLTQPVAFAMTMNVETVIFSSVVTIFVSIIFSLIPVYKAMKVKVADILRESN